jgi:alkanesulfonate monooxygenase SsuD/methylene tetrahydromethanopterin reductase-like flavin-dependent oxidoreductase (luciferase family)
MTGPILYQHALLEQHSIIVTARIRTIERLPVHLALAEQSNRVQPRIQNVASLELSHQGSRGTLPDFGTMSLEEMLNLWRGWGVLIAGSPDTVIEQLRAYEAAGVEEIILQWSTFDDFEGLELLATHVLPYV